MYPCNHFKTIYWALISFYLIQLYPIHPKKWLTQKCVSIHISALVTILLKLLEWHYNRQTLIEEYGSEKTPIQACDNWGDIEKDKKLIVEVCDLAASDDSDEI